MAEGTRRAEFVAQHGFELDPFQVRALDALDAGRSVLVAAPTGSGKTVVADYAVATALAEGRKAFYTTPLKALSNQKFGDLVRLHGASRVGLLTGDNSINGEAPIVVMTTEVLRNMIYERSPTLQGLRYVILDEVHYLQTAYRGPVWEEVIIHTAPDVDLVCLSATVSNAEEVADWIQTVRGATTAIIEERRPVDLHNLYLIGDRTSDRLHLLPTLVDGRPNPEADALDRRDSGGRGRRRLYTPRRTEVVDLLDDEDLLPVIYFIFSRAACDDAVQQCVRDGVRLTSPEDREKIRQIAESKVASLSDDDLHVLNFGSWLHALEQGVAAHHAGMVPPFKEAVEACFEAALVRVVFATETLSLGINMPARSVVIERLTKFTGERHEQLTPGEYTQLTGRAGRRGIDQVGYGVVLWSPFVAFAQVAALASRRTYALASAFRPTYNMAVNLVRRYQPAEAHHLLNLSFAQYRTDSAVVRLEADLQRAQQDLEVQRGRATCELGDVAEYRRLGREAANARQPSSRDQRAIATAMTRIRPGDVLVVPGHPGGGRVAVVATSERRGGDVRLRGIDIEGRRMNLGPRDFGSPPEPVSRVELPRPFSPNSRGFQKAVAAALRSARITAPPPVRARPGREAQTREIGAAAAAHPVAACGDLRRHLRALDRIARLDRDIARLERTVQGRTESLARQFDRVLQVLEAWGYVDGWSLTDPGTSLCRIYHECDLLVAECVRTGLFDGLDPPEVAALASAFTYEPRGPATGTGSPIPGGELRERWLGVSDRAKELNRAEEDLGLPLTRLPDPGFSDLALAWARGEGIDRVLADDEVSAGDFVRNIKQLVDLLRQLGDVAPDPDTSAAAREAADQVFRGVVAASSIVSI